MTSAPPQYQALEHTSAQMLAAALQGHWAEVTRLESVARSQVRGLGLQANPAALSPEEKRARRRALLAILRMDAQVRALAEPGWLAVQPWLSHNPARSS